MQFSVLIGFTIILAVFVFLAYKCWKEISDENSACNQDCNQGRNCDCK